MFARMKALEPGLFEDASMHAAAATQLLVEDACVSKGHSLANWNSKKIIAGTPGYNTIKKINLYKQFHLGFVVHQVALL